MIRGNVAVVRHGAYSAVYTEWCRSLGALPVPNAGQWLGSTPAGCEVCRGSPAENESPTLDRDLLNQPLTEKPSCEAEYMTAPERFADCQIPLAPRAPSIHDPTETWAAQDFRSAKALCVPSLKRDIVPLYWHAHDLRREGSHGNPHPAARIRIHTGRRSSRVAGCGARAAGRTDAA